MAGTDIAGALHWNAASRPVRLECDQIHLWSAALDHFVDRTEEFASFLSRAEHARAAQFRAAQDRRRFVIRHGLLRLVLGRTIGQSPSSLTFSYGAHGKPALETNRASEPVFFNLSHSDGVAAWAITRACPIGVDIERISKIEDSTAIAQRYFRPREQRTLATLAPELRLEAFYACWTRKEAYLKATGEGITEALPEVEVTLAPNDPPAFIAVSRTGGSPGEWQLQTFSPATDYLGSIAYRLAPLSVIQWRAETDTIRELSAE